MTVLVDLNVILDVLLDRRPHVDASAAVWEAIETKQMDGVISAHGVTTLYYLLHKENGPASARKALQSILRVFGVAPVDGTVIAEAIDLSMRDFEDAVSATAAHAAGCSAIVTRDPRGFRGGPVRAVTPEAAASL